MGASTTWTARSRRVRAARAVGLLCMILPVFSHDGAPVTEEQTVESKFGTPLLLGCPKDLRGLGSPCAVPCTVSGISSRLCRACCIALGLGEGKPSSPGAPAATAAATASTSSSSSTAVAQDLQEILIIYRAAQCLAPCVKYTAKQIRNAFEQDSQDNKNIRKGIVEELTSTNPGRDWNKIIEDATKGRYYSLVQICEKGLSC